MYFLPDAAYGEAYVKCQKTDVQYTAHLHVTAISATHQSVAWRYGFRFRCHSTTQSLTVLQPASKS